MRDDAAGLLEERADAWVFFGGGLLARCVLMGLMGRRRAVGVEVLGGRGPLDGVWDQGEELGVEERGKGRWRRGEDMGLGGLLFRCYESVR